MSAVLDKLSERCCSPESKVHKIDNVLDHMLNLAHALWKWELKQVWAENPRDDKVIWWYDNYRGDPVWEGSEVLESEDSGREDSDVKDSDETRVPGCELDEVGADEVMEWTSLVRRLGVEMEVACRSRNERKRCDEIMVDTSRWSGRLTKSIILSAPTSSDDQTRYSYQP